MNLIIGLDGFNLENFILLPKTLKRIEKFDNTIKSAFYEDLLVRGWSKIIAGENSFYKNTFYNRPKLNGTFQRTSSVNSKSYEGHSIIDYSINKSKIGIFSFPTLLPITKANGFLFGAPGGGIDPNSKVPIDGVFPKSIHPNFNKKNIWEVRSSSLAVDNEEDLFNILIDDVKTSLEIFLNLLESNQNFSFYAIMFRCFDTLNGQFISELENKSINDIENLNLKNCLKKIDHLISDFIDKLNPRTLVFTTDHGATRYKGDINFNKILHELGYQSKPKKLSRKFNLKTLIPKVIQKKLVEFKNKINPKYTFYNKPDFTVNSSLKAFSYRYIPGIYINDERFNNNLKLNKSKLIEELNNLSFKNDLKFKAISIDKKFDKKYINEYYPDIWLDIEEGYYPENRGNDFINKFTRNNQNFKYDQWQSTKKNSSFIYFGSNDLKETNQLKSKIKKHNSLIAMNEYLKFLIDEK